MSTILEGVEKLYNERRKQSERMSSTIEKQSSALRKMPYGLFIFLLLSMPCLVQGISQPHDLMRFERLHQAGARIGGWINLGDLPPATVSEGNYTFLSEVGGGSAFAEGFAALRISPTLMAEVSVGIVSRGDLELVDSTGGRETQYFGSLIVYPILAKLRLYPVGGISEKIYPFIVAGGGIYLARHDILFSGGGGSSFFSFPEKSATSFDFVLGGGFDWPVSDFLGLEFQIQYMPITFADTFLETSDWTAVTVTVGAKYLFKSRKGKKNDRERHRRP